jgi:tRNA (guanine37-N1)-methyltransferase
LANDLNLKFVEYLTHNKTINHIKDQNLKPHHLDGREFIRVSYIESKGFAKHYVMNLPAIAVEFLDLFREIVLTNELIDEKNMPFIHCYCFSRDDQPQRMITAVLGCEEEDLQKLSIYNVRNVTPNKQIYCVSFKLPTKDKLKATIDTNKKPKIN